MRLAWIAAVFVVLLSACVHPWVGRPVAQLERELGRPRAIRNLGPDKVYVYPDTLAGRGEMTFTIDSKGIIRSWNATTNVPGPFGEDVFGTSDPANTVIVPTNP
jgi:hypothetical protein